MRVQKIEVATNNLQTWRLDTEVLVDDLRLKVTNLNKHWGQSILDSSSASVGIFSAPAPLEQAVQRLSASDVAARLNEHGDDLHN